MPPVTIVNDPLLIKKAFELKQHGMFVSDISKALSKETGERVTQMALWRMFQNNTEFISHLDSQLDSLDYPSRKEIENLFSELLQKENDIICVYGGEKLKRKLMIRILNSYLYKEFTYKEVKINLNQWVGESGFYQHWRYLSEHNFIEKVDDFKFKFCDRVKKWKNFGQV